MDGKKLKNKYKFVFPKVISIMLIISMLSSAFVIIGGADISISTPTLSKAPRLSYSPSVIDLGVKTPGFYNATFEIWNSGGNTLIYSIVEDYGWISVYPTNGSSNGEHDTIGLIIHIYQNMSGYSYSWPIYIVSNGGNGTVLVDVTVVSSPQLAFAPSVIDLGVHNPGWVGNSSFEIWNSGGGVLNYSVSESCPWIVNLYPTGGYSSGEHDVIYFGVVVSGNMSGNYTGVINIASNGGSGSVSVLIYIGGIKGTQVLKQNLFYIINKMFYFQYKK